MKRRTPTSFAACAAAIAMALAGCAAGVTPTPSETTLSSTPEASPAESGFSLTSPDLGTDGYLPDWAINSVSGLCAGTDNRSPRLEWTGTPDGTVEYLLTMTDPAHPAYVHWVVTNLDGSLAAIDQADNGEIGIGTVGVNWQGPGSYAGVCIANNTYLYTLYALDSDVPGEAFTTLERALEMIEGHVLAEASLEVKGH